MFKVEWRLCLGASRSKSLSAQVEKVVVLWSAKVMTAEGLCASLSSHVRPLDNAVGTATHHNRIPDRKTMAEVSSK